MNIVFWILVLAALAFIWFLFNPVFKIIGKAVLDAFNNTKKNMSGDVPGENEKGKDNENDYE